MTIKLIENYDSSVVFLSIGRVNHKSLVQRRLLIIFTILNFTKITPPLSYVLPFWHIFLMNLAIFRYQVIFAELRLYFKVKRDILILFISISSTNDIFFLHQLNFKIEFCYYTLDKIHENNVLLCFFGQYCINWTILVNISPL